MPQKVIEFLQKNSSEEAADGDIEKCMLVNGDLKDLLDPDKIVIRRQLIVIVIDHPLDDAEVNATVRCPNGLTRLQLFKHIRTEYRRIYRAPKKNRIWGHGIDDLWLEGAKLRGPWLHLFIGS